ncbi:HAMP domain-containing protein [Xylophilus rhododendri]|uniref:histidine kinase n=1 Tax=Xylophilus rhododendri TaxID=2697032 RepID=A0A857JA14_9BURK|nr:ATP-binding protein [Xylophilus rhododendri]QHI99588.1 HAMP domain-containing protein [Xylophilus rhododendri]
MARGVERIWVRFGLWIAGTVLVTMGLLGASVMVFAELQYHSFYRNLPQPVRVELDALNDQDLEDSPRAVEIYGQYWKGDLLFGEKWSLVIGLFICLPVGLGVGFWVSRIVTLPLASMAEAAQRVAVGDFSVRAEPGRARGEITAMVVDFNHMIDALEGLERERRATAAAVSHELRTPLAVLRARLHAVCDGVIEGDETEFRRLLGEVEHLGRLVDDLHTLSVAEAGRLSLQHERLDLGGLVEDTLTGMEPRIAQRGVMLEWVPAIGPVWVRLDRDRMRQVLTNLVENALRHASEGGWLQVALGVEGEDALLSVADDGPGLPQDMRNNPFRRFQKSLHGNSEGVGLGLSIVHALVVQQGGEVGAEDRAGGGTVFTVRMPLA